MYHIVLQNFCSRQVLISFFKFFGCHFDVIFFVICFTDNAIRLKGPLSSSGKGRVEVYHNGRWGTICDDSWDIKDANVACRQLGYVQAVRQLVGSQVPDGTGQIWLDDVNCRGSEQSLASCRHNGWGSHNCGHHEDAGVECSSTGRNIILRCCFFNLSPISCFKFICFNSFSCEASPIFMLICMLCKYFPVYTGPV